MSMTGQWNLVIDSPLGKQEGVLDVKVDGSSVSGTSTGGGVTVPVFDGSADGDRLRYSIRIKQPMPMKLVFDLTVDGDGISGTVKAGILGRQPVTGSRVQSPVG